MNFKKKGNPNFAEMKSMAEFSNQKRKQIAAEFFKSKTQEIAEKFKAEINSKTEIKKN